MSEKRCDKCEFWQGTVRNTADCDWGECHRLPPTLPANPAGLASWPLIPGDKSCGEFRLIGGVHSQEPGTATGVLTFIDDEHIVVDVKFGHIRPVVGCRVEMRIVKGPEH